MGDVGNLNRNTDGLQHFLLRQHQIFSSQQKINDIQMHVFILLIYAQQPHNCYLLQPG